MASNLEREKDNSVMIVKELIVKEPNEDDVLLGQGHYRHRGNQKLNKIVDGKVDEYKNQSRVFKTYMAHDIVNRMRNKGVRFLKELAPKGWVVVKDDKEAREKVAQRFQYMMRKQAADAKANTAAKKGPTTEKTTAKAAVVASPRLNLDWNGVNVKVPFLPVFHQLQKSSVLVDGDINAVTMRLRECFEIVGIKDSFNTEEANATLTVSDNLKMQMNLWKPLGGNRGVIVELINVAGDVQKFQKFSRYVLEAATGLFDRYKHTLFQSGVTASVNVQGHVTNFTAIMPAAAAAAPTSIATPGSVQGASDRTVLPQVGGKKKAPIGAECFKRKSDSNSNCALKRPVTNRIVMMDQPNKPSPNTSKLPVVSKATTKPGPFAPKEPVVQSSKRESEGTGDEGGALPARSTKPEQATEPVTEKTDSFASAFSRWETGIEAADNKTVSQTGGQANARKPTAAARRPFATSNFNHYPSTFVEEPRYQAMDFTSHQATRPRSNVCMHPSRAPFSSNVGDRAPMSNDSGMDVLTNIAVGRPQEGDERPSIVATSSESAEESANMPSSAAPVLPSCTRSGAVFEGLGPGPDTTGMMHSQEEDACQHPPQKDHEQLSVGQPHVVGADSAESVEPLPFNPVADVDTSERLSVEEVRRVPAFDRWAAEAPSSQEMKCDSSIDEKLDTEMIPIDHTIESIKRLSLSSNDASLVDARREFAGAWPGALANQEMKCDSSLDDEPYDASNLLSAQSFIPSSFFGAAAPIAFSNCRAPNPPSPAHSFCSHISVEMRSVPSPSPSSSSHVSVEVYSVPSPCGSFNSRCSLGVNSLKHARMDEALSPSMFESDQSAGNEPRASHLGALNVDGEDDLHAGVDLDPLDAVPPTIFVDSSSALLGAPPA